MLGKIGLIFYSSLIIAILGQFREDFSITNIQTSKRANDMHQ